MKIKLDSRVFRVGICPGPLWQNGEQRAAAVHGRDLLIAGDIPTADRLLALVDMLRMLWEAGAGIPMPPTAVAAFFVNVHRQILALGGEPSLARLDSDGVVDAGGVEHQGAEPVGAQCKICGTKFAPGDIATAAPELDPKTGKLVVRRSVDCDHCSDTMSWTERATPGGTPSGHVTAGPFYRRHDVSFSS